VAFERSANQLVARTTGERLHLLVDIGDDAGRIRSHEGVDVGFEQGASVELMVTQALSKLSLVRPTALRAVLSVPMSR